MTDLQTAEQLVKVITNSPTTQSGRIEIAIRLQDILDRNQNESTGDGSFTPNQWQNLKAVTLCLDSLRFAFHAFNDDST